MWVLDRGHGPLEITYKSPYGIRSDADDFILVDDLYKPYINVTWRYNNELNSFDVPDMGYIIDIFKQKLKEKRKELAEIGVEYEEAYIPVTEDILRSISGVLNDFKNGIYLEDVDFKLKDGWVTLTPANIQSLYVKLVNYSQKLFSIEKAHIDAISDMHIKELIHYDINQLWPEVKQS